MPKAQRRVGDVEVIKFIWQWRECEMCSNPAQKRLTYLLHNSRTNPASDGYHGDDISWRSDEEKFSCRKHERKLINDPPEGMRWCSSFPLERFKHMGFYKERADAV